jgi:phosphatidylserine decarboxylase
MDIYLPQGVSAQVAVGQRAIGGETILADLNGKTQAREAKPV